MVKLTETERSAVAARARGGKWGQLVCKQGGLLVGEAEDVLETSGVDNEPTS